MWPSGPRCATIRVRVAGGSVSTTDDRDGSTLESTRPVALDGDDIVVTTDADRRRPGRPTRLAGMATAALVIAAGLVAIVLVVRHDDSGTVRTTSPIAAPNRAAVATTPAPPTTTAPREAPTSIAVRPPVTTPRATSAPPLSTGALATTPPPAPTTRPPTTAAPPKQYGPTALTWSAPASMTVLADSTAVLSVAAHNHTDGTITLPHPLACAPRLDHGEICPEVVQVLTHGTSAGAQYTIDAHGIAPGHYALRIEGVLTVAVTVRAAS
jgi:hypothetical protein